MSNLTAKQKLFCQEYLVDLNGTQAAIRAGYSEKTAKSIANENLTKPDIKAYIDERRAVREERVQIDAEYVLKQLGEFQAAQITEIFNDDGNMKPLSDWPDHWQRMVEGIEIVSLGEEQTVTKVKLMSRTKVMEMLGKHVDVGAFAERKIVEHKESFADVLARREERLKELYGDRVH